MVESSGGNSLWISGFSEKLIGTSSFLSLSHSLLSHSIPSHPVYPNSFKKIQTAPQFQSLLSTMRMRYSSFKASFFLISFHHLKSLSLSYAFYLFSFSLALFLFLLLFT
ncbi:hypothetical protein RIF29_12413 [Crotalaria pallida]|uniref:Uncharacterized protein n=1 Tax=Crotalaria pallida TaxID=3830 RepID=A0AAN9P1Q9_CROPI